MARPAVRISVHSQAGHCDAGHTLGQVVEYRKGLPPDFCQAAFHTLMPYLYALQFGGNLPWEKEPGTAHIACPDPFNPVVFKLQRV
ncbi:MAG: TIGR04076 family protein [Bacillota bacterium]